MKTAIVLLAGLAGALVFSGCPLQTDHPEDVEAVLDELDDSSTDDLPPGIRTGVEGLRIGVSKSTVHADVGKFLLLRHDGLDVALKIVEHTRPSQDDAPTWGARYECFVFEDDDRSRFQRYTGEVYEREAGRAHILPLRRPEYVDCRTFRIQWSLADWIYFDNSISAMARTDKSDINDVNFLDDTLQWHHRAQPASSAASSTGGPSDIDTYSEKIRTGVSGNAIRAEVGRFLLLRRDGPDVALKLIEHTRPNWSDAAKPGARYECFVFENHDYSRFKKYTGEVYEPDEGIVTHASIDYGPFRVEWSQGDWIYFNDWITAMARTDKTDIQDVNFADEMLQWHHRKIPKTSVLEP